VACGRKPDAVAAARLAGPKGVEKYGAYIGVDPSSECGTARKNYPKVTQFLCYTVFDSCFRPGVGCTFFNIHILEFLMNKVLVALLAGLFAAGVYAADDGKKARAEVKAEAATASKKGEIASGEASGLDRKSVV